jgi:hypothetical protein
VTLRRDQVAFQIMHGVDRDERNRVVNYLLGQLPEAGVQEDPRHRGPLHTFLKCVAAAEQDAQERGARPEWLVVIQDDATPVPGWLDHLFPVLDSSPEPVLGLSSPGYAYRAPKVEGSDYQVGLYMTQGGAFAIRWDLLEAGLHRWCLALLDVDGYFNDDAAFSAFSWWTGHLTAVVTRSLFTQDLATTIRGHWKWTAKPFKTVEGEYPNYHEHRVEKANFGDGDETLWALLSFRWNRQAELTPTTRSRGDLPR